MVLWSLRATPSLFTRHDAADASWCSHTLTLPPSCLCQPSFQFSPPPLLKIWQFISIAAYPSYTSAFSQTLLLTPNWNLSLSLKNIAFPNSFSIGRWANSYLNGPMSNWISTRIKWNLSSLLYHSIPSSVTITHEDTQSLRPGIWDSALPLSLFIPYSAVSRSSIFFC